MARQIDPDGRLRRLAALVVGLLVLGFGLGAVIGRITAPPARGPIPVAQAPAPGPRPLPSGAAPEPAAPLAAEPAETPRAQETLEPAPPSPPPAASQAAPAPVPPAPVPPPLQADAAWRRSARATPDYGATPVIALVIDDVGMDRRGGERAIALPGPVTLSLLPYAPGIARTAKAARAAGHEILVHLPMEPQGSADPGPDAIKAGMSVEEVDARLDRALSAFDDYVGLNNHMGSKATQDPEVMRALLDRLRARGVFFLDSRTTGRSVGLDIAAAEGVPAVGRDVFIDDDPAPAAIERQLTNTEAVARRHGQALAIAHPRAGSLDSIERWLAEVQRRGFRLVPVSELVRRKIESGNALTPAAEPAGAG